MSIKSTFIINNDKLVRREDIQFLIDSRAVRYADGFFESMRAFGLEVPLFQYHYKRIKKAWKLMVFDSELPNEKIFTDAIARLLKSNKHFGSARLRLSIFRNGSGKYLPEINEPIWYLESFASDDKQFVVNLKGKLVDVFEDSYKPIHPFFSVKTNYSQIYILASLWAKKNNLDDAFIVNEKKAIIEATSSNIFVCMGNDVYTPPLKDGCIDGVMRAFLLDELIPKLGLNIKEMSLGKDIFIKADEVFISNAVQGIQWIVGYKNIRYFNKTSKSLTALLNEHCRAK